MHVDATGLPASRSDDPPAGAPGAVAQEADPQPDVTSPPDGRRVARGTVQIVEARPAVPASERVLDLRVTSDGQQVLGSVGALEGVFPSKSGLVERMYLFALDLAAHHGIRYVHIEDPGGLFPPGLRPDLDGGGQPETGRAAANPVPPDLRQGPINADTLTWFGFQHAGFWSKRDRRDQITFRGQADGRPAVYVFLVENEVRFVGAAHSGLRQRMDLYSQYGRSQTALRIRDAILQEIALGRTVHVLAQIITPVIRDIDGLPIDMVAGTQAGLRRLLQPPWNRTNET